MRLFLIGLTALAFTASAEASRRPCRGSDGKVIPCPKPTPAAQHRCKDGAGRYVKCDHPATSPR